MLDATEGCRADGIDVDVSVKAAHSRRFQREQYAQTADGLPTATRRPILVMVCSADFEGARVNLGAEAKVSAMVRIFIGLGFDVHYVDSSHWLPQWAGPSLGVPSHIGASAVTLWRPFRVPHRKFGKVLNVLFNGNLFAHLRALQPALVWIYNSYAFEGAIARRFQAAGVPVVLELEDLPLARKRSWNPKAFWDQRYFERLLEQCALVTFVNDGLMQRYQGRTQRAMLLPSVLNDGLVKLTRTARFSARRYVLGYFGGLSPEKGAAVLLQALNLLPASWHLVVTGTGALEAAFKEAARRYADRLTFHGTVSPAELHRLMVTCDVIVNPHHSIEAMRDGVFPFKVCESLASGALLVSTALPSIDVPLSDAVLFFDGSSEGLASALRGAEAFNTENKAHIDNLGRHIAHHYSEAEVARRLLPVLTAINVLGESSRCFTGRDTP